MFKDDRMMSMLTVMLVLVALGTFAQRIDWLARLFGIAPPAIELRSDEVIIASNTLTQIDVLANDQGLKPEDAELLTISEQPPCGRAYVRDGKVQYLPNARCAGPQRFSYSLSGHEAKPGEVLAVVQIGDPTQSGPTAASQRDVAASAARATRPAVPRDGAGPSQPDGQTASTATLTAAPMVPRPHAGQAAGLVPPAGVPGQAGGPGLTLQGAGSTPRMADPGSGPVASAGLPGSAVMAISPMESAGAVPASERPGDVLAGLINGRSPGDLRTGTAPPSAGGQPVAPRGTDQIELGSTDRPDPAIARAAPAAMDGSDAQGSAGSPTAATPQEVLAHAGPAATAGPVEPQQSAAPAPPAVPCNLPPGLTVDIRPGGMTVVNLDAPCDVGGVAELRYDTMDFAIPIDAEGHGKLAVPGLQPSTDAELRLPSGDGFAFELPFSDIRRIDRVALVWQAPVRLDLHAFEFGAQPGGAGHVYSGQPRSFDEVRSGGGGYMLSYAPAGEVGQHIVVYTYWRRRGGSSGVVKLKLDFASRSKDHLAATCGAGALAQPEFRVLRSRGGRLGPPGLRQLAAQDCTAVAGAESLIADAIDDMVILRK